MIEFETIIHFFLVLPFYIKFALVGSVFALSGILGMYLILGYMRISFDRKVIKNKFIEKELSRLTADLITSNNKLERLYSNDTFFLTVNKLKAFVNGSSRKKSELVEYLIGLKKLFDGESGKVLREVYFSLGLHNHAKYALARGNVQKKIIALRELLQMDVLVDFSLVRPLLKHKNQMVRRTARCYCIKNFVQLPFDFFSIGCSDLQLWEQLELFSIVSQRETPNIPSFSNCLDEKLHPSVISFYLKMVVFFRQTDAIPAMKRLLSSKNITIVKETIHAMGEFQDSKIEDFFIANYQFQPDTYKIEILKAIGKIKSDKYLYFLNREFQESAMIDIKKHVIKSLISKNPETGNLLWYLKTESPGINNTVIEHVMNPLIKN